MDHSRNHLRQWPDSCKHHRPGRLTTADKQTRENWQAAKEVVLAVLLASVLNCVSGVPSHASEPRPQAGPAHTIGAGFDRDSRPLPLAANWNCNAKTGYGPEWQYEQMKKGHHLLFSIKLGKTPVDDDWKKRHQPIFTYLSERKAPLCLRWTNLLDMIKNRSPFSPLEPWRKAGEESMGSYQAQLKQMQEWYPDPPYVVMLSNNEGKAPSLKKALKSPEYLKAHGESKDEAYKQKTVGAAYLERYKAMFDGMRAGSGTWGSKMRFIGYAWGGEANINMYNRLDSPLAWDGVSARNYVDRGLTDYKPYSTSTTAMNLRLKKAWYASQKKQYHFEISPWWRKKTGVPPQRYGAMAIWNLWMARPHSMRQFTSWGGVREQDWPWYREVIKAVDMVHRNETLRTFWKQGDPVVNSAIEISVHVIDAPPDEGTWAQGRLKGFVSDKELKLFKAMSHAYYGLKTNIDPTAFAPKREKHEGRVCFAKDAEFRVWAQAHVMGAKPKRRWLLFTYAPRGTEKGVKITLPGFRDITLDVPQKGVFAVVDEGGDELKKIEVPEFK